MQANKAAAPLAQGGYAAWNGPIERLPEGTGVRLLLREQHLNMARRMHGGLTMGLLAMAMRQSAASGTAAPALRTMHVDFLDSAYPGDTVEAHAQTTRLSRTLVFVRAAAQTAGRVTATASGIYQREPLPVVMSARSPARVEHEGPPAGYMPAWVGAAFSRHAGPIYQARECAQRWAMRILPRHLESGDGVADVGAALLLADVALGLRVLEATGSKPCATLSLDVCVFGHVHTGDLLTADCRHLGEAGNIHVLSAQLAVGELPVMSMLGNWKQLG